MDESLSWKEHLKLTENKVAKIIGLIYKAKPYLNKDSLLALYFFYIHSYINFATLVKLNLLNTAVLMHKIKNNFPIIIPWKIWATCSFVSNTFLKWELQETIN